MLRLADNCHFVMSDGACVSAWVVAVNADGTVDLFVSARPTDALASDLSRAGVVVDPGKAPGTCHAVH